jgi:hypothetical protein
MSKYIDKAHYHLVFLYDGVISQEFILNLKDLIKGVLKAHKDTIDKKHLKKLFEISVEELQNIMDYSKNYVVESFKQQGIGIYTIGYDEEKHKYFLNVENLVDENDKNRLTNQLSKINNMDKYAQRKYLRNLLRENKGLYKKGAGIGFLEIAKRSSDKLQYEFKKRDEGILFDLKVYV